MKYLLIILSLSISIGCSNGGAETSIPQGTSIPTFNLLLSDGTTKYNTKDIPEGKPTVLFYFGPHCPYSRAEMSDIIKNMSSLKDIHFLIFTIPPFHDFEEFSKNYQLNKYPNITAGVDYASYFSWHFRINAVPFIAIYGKDRKLRKALFGRTDITTFLESEKD